MQKGKECRMKEQWSARARTDGQEKRDGARVQWMEPRLVLLCQRQIIKNEDGEGGEIEPQRAGEISDTPGMTEDQRREIKGGRRRDGEEGMLQFSLDQFRSENRKSVRGGVKKNKKKRDTPSEVSAWEKRNGQREETHTAVHSLVRAASLASQSKRQSNTHPMKNILQHTLPNAWLI